MSALKVPEHLEARVNELISIEQDGATKKQYWAVVLGLIPVRDGDQYCILWGENLATGVAAFGSSAAEAIGNFEIEMYKTLPNVPTEKTK